MPEIFAAQDHKFSHASTNVYQETCMVGIKGEVSCKFECHFKTQKWLSVNTNKNNCLVLL